MDSPALDFPADLISIDTQEEKLEVDNLSTPTVRFLPISLSYVLNFWEEVLEKKKSPDVQVFTVISDIKDLNISAGTTCSLRDIKSNGNIYQVYFPFRTPNVVEVPKANLREKPREEWSTEEVVENVILPWMAETETCVVDAIPPEFVGEPFEGYFVSQARACKFSDLVAAIRHYFVNKIEKGEKLDLSKVFIWLDIFCANQPQLCAKEADPEVQLQRYKILEKGLHSAIAHFDDRLIFFDDFAHPTPINRAWCVWELYGIAKNKLSLDIICSPEAADDLARKFTSGNLKVLDMLSGLNLKGMQCHNPEDLDMITKAVESLDGGFVQLKQTVTDTLRKWVLRFSTQLRLRRAKELKGTKNYTIDDAHLLYRTAVVLNDFSQNDLSIAYSNASIEIYQQLNQGLWVAFAWRELGKVYLNKRDAEKALEYHEKELDYYLKNLTPQMYGEKYYNLTVGAAYMSIGNALDGLKRPNEAMKNYDDAFEAYVKAYTEKSLDAANVLICKGRVYQFLGNMDQAEKMMLRAMDIKLELFGPDNVTMGYDYSNLAWLYINTQNWEKAHEFLFKSLHVRQEVLGELHYLVALAYNHIAYCYRLESRFDESLEYYFKAIEVYKVISPTSSETADLFNNVGYVYVMQQKYELSNEYYEKAKDMYQMLNMQERVDQMDAGINWNNTKLKTSKTHTDI